MEVSKSTHGVGKVKKGNMFCLSPITHGIPVKLMGSKIRTDNRKYFLTRKSHCHNIW